MNRKVKLKETLKMRYYKEDDLIIKKSKLKMERQLKQKIKM